MDINNKSSDSVAIHSSSPCPSQICTHTLAEIGFTLNCSVQANLSGANADTSLIEWLFNSSFLPSDIILSLSNTTTRGDTYNTYKSTLQFPPLELSYAGEYTCRVRGNGRWASSVDVTINGTSHIYRPTTNDTIIAVIL